MVADMQDHEHENHQTRAESGFSDGSVGKQGGCRRYGLNPLLDGCSQMHSDGLTHHLSETSTGRIVEWPFI
jgi:hypothetical protein